MFLSFRNKIIVTLLVTVITFGFGGAIAGAWLNQNDQNEISDLMKQAHDTCVQKYQNFLDAKKEMEGYPVDPTKYPKESQQIKDLLVPRGKCESELTGNAYVQAMRTQGKVLDNQTGDLNDARDAYEAARSDASSDAQVPTADSKQQLSPEEKARKERLRKQKLEKARKKRQQEKAEKAALDKLLKEQAAKEKAAKEKAAKEQAAKEQPKQETKPKAEPVNSQPSNTPPPKETNNPEAGHGN